MFRMGLGLGGYRFGYGAQRGGKAPQPLQISGTPVGTATKDAAYAGFTATASDGKPPYTYSLVGTWPAGISINASTGAVSGTPTVSGSFAGLSVRVTDAASNTADLPSFALAVAAPVTDPHFANVVLLCGFNGPNGSTTASDESSKGRALTFVGSARIDTSQSKFGGSSLLLDGSSAAVTAANSSDFLFGSGSFTIEAFIRFNSLPTPGNAQYICSVYDTNSQRSWSVALTNVSGTFKLSITIAIVGTSATEVSAANWSPSSGVWYHVAFEREDTAGANERYRTYVNGSMLGKVDRADLEYFAATAKLSIGSYLTSGAPAGNYFNGWLDELRITKGVARYASDAGFAVPTAPFPRS